MVSETPGWGDTQPRIFDENAEARELLFMSSAVVQRVSQNVGTREWATSPRETSWRHTLIPVGSRWDLEATRGIVARLNGVSPACSPAFWRTQLQP